MNKLANEYKYQMFRIFFYPTCEWEQALHI
jgi:hypothetical protein